MLSDTKLRNLKAQDKMYKVADRDGLYVAVTKAGGISFRYNCQRRFKSIEIWRRRRGGTTERIFEGFRKRPRGSRRDDREAIRLSGERSAAGFAQMG